MKKAGDDFVWQDVTHQKKTAILAHFPNIYAKCLSIGIDLARAWVPVTPAAHYLCGGIMVDEYGRSSIRNLYACGECASTGLHGRSEEHPSALQSLMPTSYAAFCSKTKTWSYYTVT